MAKKKENLEKLELAQFEFFDKLRDKLDDIYTESSDLLSRIDDVENELQCLICDIDNFREGVSK